MNVYLAGSRGDNLAFGHSLASREPFCPARPPGKTSHTPPHPTIHRSTAKCQNYDSSITKFHPRVASNCAFKHDTFTGFASPSQLQTNYEPARSVHPRTPGYSRAKGDDFGTRPHLKNRPLTTRLLRYRDNNTAKMSLTNCRFYEEKFPEIDSFVMVNVKQVRF